MTTIDRALAASDPSARLQAALTAGTRPDPARIPALIRRCGAEPDFYVRDMLTWALARHSADATVPLLLAELGSPIPQARSQALHTLSKIGDARAWPAITDDLLRDPDDEVARAAWRTAAGLAPEHERERLARRLVLQLGRGDRELRRSLARAFAELGTAAEPVLRGVVSGGGVEGGAVVGGALEGGARADGGVEGGALEGGARAGGGVEGGAAERDAVGSDLAGRRDAASGSGRRASRDARLHAAVALVLIRDPESGFDAALHDAEHDLGD